MSLSNLSSGPLLTMGIALGFFLFSVLWVSNSAYDEDLRKQSEYCEMVQRWKATGGESGWPEFGPPCQVRESF